MSRLWNLAFLDLQRHVDELFEELIYRRWAIAPPADWQPPLDLHETPDAYLVEIDLPGVAPEEVKLVVGEHDLTVTGQRRAPAPEGTTCSRCERKCGPFRRALDLAEAIDPETVRAEYRNGTCRIHLTKKRPPSGPGGGTELP